MIDVKGQDFYLVSKDNFDTVDKFIQSKLKNTEFVAIDLEFSGLGDTKAIRISNIKDRYKSLRDTVHNYAICSVALTLFSNNSDGYETLNFEFPLNCNMDYKVSNDSLKFLVRNGFDYHVQLQHGVEYTPKHSYEKQIVNRQAFPFDKIIRNHLLRKKVPLVFHNGLLDLMFIYGHFYAPLPESLDVFLADLSDMIEVYDTKYISEFFLKENRSFLAYLYHKYLRFQDSITIKEGVYPVVPVKEKAKEEVSDAVFCEKYANHGFCKAEKCSLSHDLDVILDHELHKLPNKKRKIEDEKDSLDKERCQREEETSYLKQTTLHSSAGDSFMTGYIFCYQSSCVDQLKELCRNRLYLSGKNMPILVQKSNFVKYSDFHQLQRGPVE
jgi:target of EGR1 protein 1